MNILQDVTYVYMTHLVWFQNSYSYLWIQLK